MQGNEYFIPTTFGKYQTSYSVVKADYVFPYIYMRKYTPLSPQLKNKIPFKFFKHLNLYYMHFPTYKHGNYTKLMQIKLITA